VLQVGMRMMLQHIMRREHVNVLWVWGPVTQYQISLDGIDSSSTTSGLCPSSVMDVIVREDATRGTMSLLLDDFMTGFLYTLYQQKWHRFGWYLHVMLTALDALVVVLAIQLCLTIKLDGASQHAQNMRMGGLLLTLLAAFLAVELLQGAVYACSLARRLRTLRVRELLARTWTWMLGFYLGANLVAAGLIVAALGLYMLGGLGQGGTEEEAARQMSEDGLPPTWRETNPLSDHLSPETMRAVESLPAAASKELAKLLASRTAVPAPVGNSTEAAPRVPPPMRRLGAEIMCADYTSESEGQRIRAVHDWTVRAAEAAAWPGAEPLVWLLLALGFLSKLYAFLMKASMAQTSLSILMLSVKQTLAGDFFAFLALFLVFVGGFVLITHGSHSTWACTLSTASMHSTSHT
jgi:hypothetical protein